MKYKEKIKAFWKWLVKAANWLMKPIIEDFNFFLVMWFINCGVTFGYLVGCFYLDGNHWDHGLRCLALGTFVCYLLTLGLHMCRKRPIRAL